MSKPELDRFIGDAQTSTELQETLKGKSTDPAAIVTVARARGYDVTSEDVDAHVSAQKRQLSDQDLDAVAGGRPSMIVVVPVPVVIIILPY
jgi:predicted ribosomally synthesized peptide with nif11-like leader